MDIDLNCDLGEGCPFDSSLLELITSANIACGFHAGDPSLAHKTLALARQHGVQAGAHPSFPDRENFGRKEIERSSQQIYEDCVYQIGGLVGLARAAGVTLTHVKAHGALYNLACKEDAYAEPVLAAAALFDLTVLGLPGSRLEALISNRCLFVAEGFADRRYLTDGTLVPRSSPDAVIEDPYEAAKQTEWLIRERGVQTICVHGDNPHALVFVQELHVALTAARFRIVPFVPARK